MHMTVQPVILLDLEFRGIPDGAAVAVSVAIFAVDSRVDFWEEVSGGGLDGHALMEVECGKRFRRSGRREKRATTLKSGGQEGSHFGQRAWSHDGQKRSVERRADGNCGRAEVHRFRSSSLR